jgi:hypothetical protein
VNAELLRLAKHDDPSHVARILTKIAAKLTAKASIASKTALKSELMPR